MIEATECSQAKPTVEQLPGHVVFIVRDEGDPSVGIPANESTVTTWVDDKEALESVRLSLQEWFTELHDFPVTVSTKAELVTSDSPLTI